MSLRRSVGAYNDCRGQAITDEKIFAVGLRFRLIFLEVSKSNLRIWTLF